MLHRRITLSLIALMGLVLGLSLTARADYGITSSRPLSDPMKAKLDPRLIGTWSSVIRGETYYFHIGAGNITGKLNWMEVVLVKPGKKKPAFYMRHFVGFPTIIGDKNYFNIGYTAKLVPQLRGAKPEELVASVDRYDVFEYKFVGDKLEIMAPSQKVVRASIKAGKIKGSNAKVDDTVANLLAYIKLMGKKMFTTKFVYTRVKEPEPKKKAPAKKPVKTKAPAK